MSLSVTRLGDIRRTVLVTFETDDGPVEISVTYRLSSMNLNLSDWLKDHGDDRGAIMGWLERIIAAWDIVDDGKPVPVTAEAMERYGFATPLLRLILDQLYADADAGNLRRNSATGSLVSTIALNGTK